MRCISEFSTSQFKHKNKQQNQIYVQKCDQHSTSSVWWGEKVFTLHIFFNIKHSRTFTCDNVLFHISPSDSLACCEHADLSEVRRATLHYIQFQVSQHYAITAKKEKITSTLLRVPQFLPNDTMSLPTEFPFLLYT